MIRIIWAAPLSPFELRNLKGIHVAFKKRKFISHSSESGKSKIKVPANMVRACFLVHNSAFSMVPSHGGKGKGTF